MFATGRFLRHHFHTPGGLIAFLNSYNAPTPPAATVEKWFYRESVPSSWFAMLLAYLEFEEGKPISLSAFLEFGHAEE